MSHDGPGCCREGLAEPHSGGVQHLVQAIGLQVGRERARDLRHGQDLVNLRTLALAVADHLAMPVLAWPSQGDA